ncbi:MAG: hypothetical protein K0Q59_5837, partial [Paenibacillus sp.]|nr:hypothetical protein [Paenibacillus sp.]
MKSYSGKWAALMLSCAIIATGCTKA